MSSNQTQPEAQITDSMGRPISRRVVEVLETLRSRVRPGLIAAELWDLFNDSERECLGGDPLECWLRLGTVGMWREVRGGSLEQALVRIARAMDLVNERDLRTLRREIQLEGLDVPTGSPLPSWNPSTGELSFGGCVIRRLRVLRSPSNIQRIVDAFQAAGWPARISNPLPAGQEELHQTLRSLNGRLEAIRFHAQEGGQAVVWELC